MWLVLELEIVSSLWHHHPIRGGLLDANHTQVDLCWLPVAGEVMIHQPQRGDIRCFLGHPHPEVEVFVGMYIVPVNKLVTMCPPGATVVTCVHVIHIIILMVPQVILRPPSRKPKVLNNIIVPEDYKEGWESLG